MKRQTETQMDYWECVFQCRAEDGETNCVGKMETREKFVEAVASARRGDQGSEAVCQRGKKFKSRLFKSQNSAAPKQRGGG